VNVKHRALVRVTIKDGRNVLTSDDVPAELVDAHLTVQSYMRGGAFNGHNWETHDRRPPQVNIKLVNPEDELQDGELCDCVKCLPIDTDPEFS
jgi:hypothetical protein